MKLQTDSNPDKADEKKEKLKNWLKNPVNLILILIILSSFFIRVYYLYEAQDQTLWWDEAEYMATSKKWAFGIPYDDNEQRPPLFQLLGAFLLKIGLEELGLKFLLVILPSTLSVFFVYLLGKELFGKKTGLIAAAASGFVWTFIFWSARFQPDFLSINFQILALLNFWKLFKNGYKKNAVYAGIFAGLGFYFKISALLIPLSVLIFILARDGLHFIKNKNYWICLLAFIVMMAPFMVWQYYSFGNPLAFAPSYIGGTGIGQGWDFGWMVLNYYHIFPKILFFILFLVGILYSIFTLGIKIDILLKDKEQRNNPYLFSITVLLVTTLFYIFYIRGVIEDRWVFLIIPFIFYYSAEGFNLLRKALNIENSRNVMIIIILVLALFIYPQVKHADDLIDLKKESYLPVKESSLWIKENSQATDIIFSNSYTQATAYSERKIVPYPYWKKDANSPTGYVPLEKEAMNKLIEENKPKFIVVSVFEKHPDWINEWVNENTNRLSQVKVYFADEQQTQPLLVVYEVIYT